MVAIDLAKLNWLAVIVTGIVSWIIGAIWYAPPVFGNRWMKLVGIKPEDARASAGKALVGGLVLAIITSFFLAIFINFMAATTFVDGAIGGFLVWLGFIATAAATGVLFERRPVALYAIGQTHLAIAFIVMGIILAVWRP